MNILTILGVISVGLFWYFSVFKKSKDAQQKRDNEIIGGVLLFVGVILMVIGGLM